MANTEAILDLRLQLHDDFRLYAETCLKIRTKEGEIKPLILNTAQEMFLEKIEEQYRRTGRIRAVILKGRQQGLSTVIGARGYWKNSQRRARKALVLAHKSDSSTALFDMVKRYHELVPKLVKPSTKYSSRRELQFDKLDSSYVVTTAGGSGIGRGETFQFVHASEVAFWEPAHAQSNWNALDQSIPNADDTEVYIESTANGVTGVFYTLWKDAVDGTNDYIPIFIPWFVQTEYRERDVPEDFTRTPDEDTLTQRVRELYGVDLDDGQLFWRRRKVAKNGLDLFRQEYPSWPEEAFLTTGRPVFHPEIVNDMLVEAKQAPLPMRYALDGLEWHENPRGELEVYDLPEPGETYYIGADIAAGLRGGDYSVAVVQDAHRRTAAVWRGHVNPDFFATILARLGIWYNTAFLCPESNGHGILTCARLARDLAYPHLYQNTQYDQVTEKETVKVGFQTTVKTKPLIIDELRAHVRDRTIDIRSRKVLEEMQTYVMTETGAMEAEAGCHDDCVMALALANHVNAGTFTPIITPADCYTTVP